MALEEDELRLSPATRRSSSPTRARSPRPRPPRSPSGVARHAVRTPSGCRDRLAQRLDAARPRRGRGRGDPAGEPPRLPYDGVLLVPAFFEAGPLHPRRRPLRRRHPRGRRPSSPVTPPSATRARTSVDFVREKTGEDALSVLGRAPRTAGRRAAGSSSMPRATTTSTPSCAPSRDSGRRFLYRTGPSFVRALAGLPAKPAADRRPRTAARSRPGGRRLARRPDDAPGRGRERAAASSSST